jgi:hypothetical protein
MLEVENSVFERFSNNATFQKMQACETLPIDISFGIARLTKELVEKGETYFQFKNQLIEKFCDRDEEGKPVIGDNGQFDIIEKREPFMEEMSKLLLQKIELNCSKVVIYLDDLEEYQQDYPIYERLKMSPLNMMELEFPDILEFKASE